MTQVLQIDDKEYTLEYDFNTQVAAEQATGVNLFAIETLNSATFRAIVYSHLLKHQPEITLDEVSALIRPATQAKIMETLEKLREE